MKSFSSHPILWAILSIFFLITNASAQLSGTYTIGGSNPNYTTISAAVAALKSPGISAPVVFNIRNGTYTESFTIDNIQGSSAVNQVTFKSESGDSSKVIIQFPGNGVDANWKLNNVSNLSFTGLTWHNNGTQAHRLFEGRGVISRLAFTNSVFSSNASGEECIEIITDQADSIRINNNHFKGPLRWGIYLSNSDVRMNAVEIQNNLFTDTVLYGIGVYGYNSSYGLRIVSNNFSGITDETIVVEEFNNVLIRDIRIKYAEDALYLYDDRDVYIENVVVDAFEDYGVETDYVYGFHMLNCHFKATPTGFKDAQGLYAYELNPGSIGVRIEANSFYGLNQGETGIYMEYIYGTNAQRALIVNNMISGFTEAMRLNGDMEHCLIAHNSLNAYGSANHHPLTIWYSWYDDVLLKNNIISNKSSSAEAIYMDDTTSIAQGDVSLAYNAYHYAPGKKHSNFHQDLPAMQAMGADANSFVDDPLFYSDSTDLHICNLALRGKGDTCKEVDKDFEGTSRATLPVTGAHEADSLGANFKVKIDQLKVSFTNTSTGHATSYAWDFGDGNSSALKNPVHTYTTAANYRIKLIARNSYCGFIDSVSYYLNAVGMETTHKDNEVLIYPNPSKGIFKVELSEADAEHIIEVYDLNGSRLFHDQFSGTYYDLNVHAFASGTYLLVIRTEAEIFQRKIVIIK